MSIGGASGVRRGGRCAMSFAVRSRRTDRESLEAPRLRKEASTMSSMARRMFELVEPIGVIPYSADEPNEAMFALGFTNYWDIYFAGRAAPLGLVPPEVVDALFYNFAPGEGARHIPKVWRPTTPDAAIAARHQARAPALRLMLGDRIHPPAFG